MPHKMKMSQSKNNNLPHKVVHLLKNYWRKDKVFSSEVLHMHHSEKDFVGTEERMWGLFETGKSGLNIPTKIIISFLVGCFSARVFQMSALFSCPRVGQCHLLWWFGFFKLCIQKTHIVFCVSEGRTIVISDRRMR